MVVEKKISLRREISARLRALPAERHAIAGEAITDAIMAFVKPSSKVALFASTSNEISTRSIDERLRAKGVIRAVPAVVDGVLVFREIADAAHLLPLGPLAIPTPPDTLPATALASCGAVIVPGLAFDRRGYRLGYGRGYYDRALAGVDLERCVAICHDEQLVDAVPHEPHDVRLRWLCTPARGVFAAVDAA